MPWLVAFACERRLARAYAPGRRAGVSGCARRAGAGGAPGPGRPAARARRRRPRLEEAPAMPLAEVRAARGARGLVFRSGARPRVLRRPGLPRQQSPAPRRHRPARPGGTRGPPGAPVNPVLTPTGWCSSTRPGPRPPYPAPTAGLRAARACAGLATTPCVAGLTRRGRIAPVGRPSTLDRDACAPYLKAGRVPARRPGARGVLDPRSSHTGPQARKSMDDAGAPRLVRPPRPSRLPSPRPGRRPAPGPPPTGRRAHRRWLGARQRPPLTPLLSPSKATPPSPPRDTALQDRIPL